MAGFQMDRVQRGVIARWLGVLLVFSVLAAGCHSAPSFKLKTAGNEDEESMLTPDCDQSTGRCQVWLPVVDEDGTEQEPLFYRAQPIHVRDAEEQPIRWRDAPVHVTDPETSQAQSASGRLGKKDGYPLRTWGAGGMPFSVLYMSPRPNHPPQTSSSQTEKSADTTRRNDSGRSNQSSYRMATRNYNQQRRLYSILPQLFISYGWGPSGK